jgi:glutaredoxin
MEWTRIDGRDRGSIRLYALSTCGWCAKTKQLLKDLGVTFQYVYVDLLPPVDMQQVLTEVERYNPKGSFPTIVIDDSKIIVGFQEDRIREAVKG